MGRFYMIEYIWIKKDKPSDPDDKAACHLNMTEGIQEKYEVEYE